MTDDEINELGRKVFEKHNGRPHPWEGLQPWVIALVRAAIAAEAAPAPVAPWPEFDASTDPMYEPAKAIVLEHRRASISLVQRHLRIGYNRAARLLERMEKEGLIGPLLADGGRQLLA